jgi:hypothetical protein
MLRGPETVHGDGIPARDACTSSGGNSGLLRGWCEWRQPRRRNTVDQMQRAPE